MPSFSGNWMIVESPTLLCDACGCLGDHLIHVADVGRKGRDRFLCGPCAAIATGQTHLRCHGETADGPACVTFDLQAGAHDFAWPNPSSPS